MKLELTINVEYLPEWKAYEGLRELLQNGKDAETEHNARLTVRYRKDVGVLVIENEGVTLPHESLLFGTTTKAERNDTIGKFGEGLKLGMLALVRAGHPVKIRSGSEVWVPSIQRSEKFQADVLVVDIQAGRKEDCRVQVEVAGVSEESWNAIRERFLFLPGVLKAKDHISTTRGDLLLNERYQGCIFVKGIFVQKAKTRYGYNFTSAVTVDRDRKMVSTYDLQWHTSALWREAMATRPDLVGSFLALLDEQSEDVSGIESYTAGQFSEAVRQEVVNSFRQRHGADAVPVSSLSESAEIAHLGKSGIITPKAAKALLESVLGSLDTVKVELAKEEQRVYGWHELTEEERANLTRAIGLVDKVESVSLDQVNVVDYRDPKLEGMFKAGAISVARRILTDRSETLTVLVHEVAHRDGNDGEVSHVRNLERIWAGIVTNLSS